MMSSKRLILIWLTLAFALAGRLHGQGINFSDEYWEEAIDRAAEEERYLFVDCYTSWCGPCKKMDKQVFPIDSVGEFYNNNFINLKLDMESKEGKKFADRYQILGYPTYLIINGKGEVMVRSCGYQPPAKFIQFGNSGLQAEVSLTAMQQRYDKWDRDPEFLYNYFKVLQQGCYPVNDLVSQYLNGLTVLDMVKTANWRIFNEYMFDMESAIVKAFLTQPDVIVKAHGKKAVFEKVITLYQRDMFRRYAKASGKDDYSKINKEYAAQLSSAPALWKDAMLGLNDLYYFGARKESAKYAAMAKELVIKQSVSVPIVLNDIGQYYLEHIDDKKQLKELAGWIKPIYTETDNTLFYVTYAAVLYKIGDDIKAKEVEEEMLILGEELGSNMSYLKEKLEQLKN